MAHTDRVGDLKGATDKTPMLPLVFDQLSGNGWFLTLLLKCSFKL